MPAEVAFTRCADYDSRRVQEAVDAAVELLGGWSRFVKPGSHVLVKPNLLSDAVPDEAKTTHPEVVRAVIRSVREQGAECRVGDSPGSVMKLERVWETTGMRALCEAEGVELVSLEGDGARAFEADGIPFAVARRVLDADLVVNVPKVKTHTLTGLTCGVKNIYGCVPGMRKVAIHRDCFNPRKFSAVLAAIYAAVRPGLTLADGIVGMEGNGPSSGRPATLGFVAASPDAAALDTCLCRLLGLDPRAVPYLPLVAEQGVGEADPARIEVRGESIESLKPASFLPPNTLKARLVPQWMVGLLSPFIWCRPHFNEACVRCGLCVRTCPAEALSLPKGDPHPRLDPRACIDCCCCQEVCPEAAIEMRPSPLLRHVFGA